jgi:hypothetical protein
MMLTNAFLVFTMMHILYNIYECYIYELYIQWYIFVQFSRKGEKYYYTAPQSTTAGLI